VLGHRLIAYVIENPEKCSENAKDEVSTWYARCAVGSGCLKSPDKRLKSLLLRKQEGLLTEDPGYEFACHLFHHVYWEVIYMSEYVLLLLLFVLEGMIVPAMLQTT
jgi:hypothetical protein